MPSCMPPPPAPLAHRRSRVNTTNFTLPLPSSRLPSPESTACSHRKMSLSKGATFHVPSTPPAEDDPVLSIPHLARRSPTSSHASLLDLISDKRGVVSQSIQDFEHTFSGARGKRLSTHRRPSSDFDRQLRQYKRAAAPLDEGIASSIASTSEKELARTLSRALSFQDSALGSSIKSEGVVVEDNASVQDLVQEQTNGSGLEPSRTRQQGIQSHKSSAAPHSALTQSHAPESSQRVPRLSRFAKRKLKKNILDPILQEERFEVFHPLVTSVDPKNNKSVRSLRDLEQRLILQAQTLAVSQHLYRTFGEFSIQLVLDTYQHLAESEQRRPIERPYDSGYFLDLVQQVGRLAAQVGQRREAIVNGTAVESTAETDFDYSSDDEITLEGGLGETGEIAELVRWKDGKGTSLRTMQPYEPLLGLKRQHSGESLDDDVARSMARRKKGEIPKIVEMKCADPTCDKIFTRKCDLAKHEKTHSRPHKCPEKTCKYHHEGLPTEKEMQRHVNDKHSSDPKFYRCKFDNCIFQSKRESNTKQHMEKKHGWVYERVKGSAKVIRTPGQTPQTPSMDYSPSPAPTLSSNRWETASTSPSDAYVASGMQTPLDFAEPMDFNTLPGTTYSGSLFPNQSSQYVQAEPDFGFETSMQAPAYGTSSHMQHFAAPINTQPRNGQFGRSPITPAYSNITYDQDDSPVMRRMDSKVDYTSPDTYKGLPTPESSSNFLQPHSRNPSISYESPMDMDAQTFGDDTIIMGSMAMNSGNAYISHSQLPADDFPLYGAEAGPSDYMSRAGPGNYAYHDYQEGNNVDYSAGCGGDIDLDSYLNL